MKGRIKYHLKFLQLRWMQLFYVLLALVSYWSGRLIDHRADDRLVERNRLSWQIGATNLAGQLAAELRQLLVHPADEPERLYVTGNLYLNLGEKSTPKIRRHFIEQYSRYYGEALIGRHQTLSDLALILNHRGIIKLDESLKRSFLHYKNTLSVKQKEWLERQNFASVKIMANCWGISVIHLQPHINDRSQLDDRGFFSCREKAIKVFWQRLLKLKISKLKTLVECSQLLHGFRTWRTQHLIDWLTKDQLPEKMPDHRYLGEILRRLEANPGLKVWLSDSKKIMRYHRATVRLSEVLINNYFALSEDNRSEINWIIQLLQQRIRALLIGEAAKEIARAWQEYLVRPYSKSVIERYPFKEMSKSMVKNGDFANCFGNDGALEKFFKRYLDHLIVKIPVFRYVTWPDGEKLALPQQWLSLRIKTALLQQLFFLKNCRYPQLKLTWLPLSWPNKMLQLQIKNYLSGNAVSLAKHCRIVWDASSPLIIELKERDSITNSIKITNFAQGLQWLEQHFSFKSYGEINFKINDYLFCGLLKTSLANRKIWEVLHHFWP